MALQLTSPKEDTAFIVPQLAEALRGMLEASDFRNERETAILERYDAIFSKPPQIKKVTDEQDSGRGS